MKIKIEESADGQRLKLVFDDMYVCELPFLAAYEVGILIANRAQLAVNPAAEKIGPEVYEGPRFNVALAAG